MNFTFCGAKVMNFRQIFSKISPKNTLFIIYVQFLPNLLHFSTKMGIFHYTSVVRHRFPMPPIAQIHINHGHLR